MTKLNKIVLASGNQGKLKELRDMLSPLGLELVSQADFNITPAEENATTFIENALLKARHVAEQTGLPTIADDSGLAVDALGGAPGIYSARYAGEHGDDAANNALLLESLINVAEAERTASFRCALVLLRCASAELDKQTKNKMSHRGKAVKELIRKLSRDGVC